MNTTSIVVRERLSVTRSHCSQSCMVNRIFNRIYFLLKGRELIPNKKTAITYGGGVSCLISDDVTADNAGKYEVSVENKLGKDRRCFSVAVEGTYSKIRRNELLVNVVSHVQNQTEVILKEIILALRKWVSSRNKI